MHKDKPEELSRTLKAMLREARKREAPVFQVSNVASTPFRALVFTILSARTKDATTIRASGKLLAKAPTAKKLAGMRISDIEKAVYGTGFYRQKAKNLKKTARLISDNGGKVPDTLEELVKLPGVGRKTANIILAHCFGKDAIAVDTHVHRICNRLGLVRTKTPEKTEQALMKKVPKRLWKEMNLAMVSYGQTVCTPLKPKCGECRIRKICPRIGVG
ncbi:MAG: endonuclease III [Candidatus Micrarchaeota archaeon]